MNPTFRKISKTLLILLLAYLAVSYLLPIALPFLLGGALALAAEPMVGFFTRRLRLPRGAAAGIGVTMAFSILALVIMVLCAFLIRQLRSLADIVPDLESAIQGGMDSLSAFLLELAARAPFGLSSLLTGNVTEFFSGGSALLDRVTDWLLRLASGILSHVPSSALTLATAIISSFMISAKLPQIRSAVRARLPFEKLQPFLDTLKRLKSVIFGWLKAQAKLSGITFLVAMAGLFLLRISHAPLWAVIIALVDAMPILGSGTVLIPWSLVSFLQGDHVQAFGLLGLYGAAAITRSVMEPRLLGQQLGLDPLVTLAALYTGYRLWGFGGMILAPMLAVTVTQIVKTK